MTTDRCGITAYGPLGDIPTSELIETYRFWPRADVQAELESRGVVLWHFALRPVA